MAAVGCKKSPHNVTVLPGARAGSPTDPRAAGPRENISPRLDTGPVSRTEPQVDHVPINPPVNPPIENTTGIPLPDPNLRKNWVRNAEILQVDTVHFEFDSSVVKASEKSKVQAVADYLKANPGKALEIDGNCDERGTEEYNRSLGERRALALREELLRLGVDAMLMDTVSYGKDKPADPGHDETAWRQNRRGEFLVEMPPAAP